MYDVLLISFTVLNSTVNCLNHENTTVMAIWLHGYGLEGVSTVNLIILVAITM